MKSHPLSEAFPLMDAADLRTLADDIAAHGLKEPVVTYEGMILDGRNRWAACKLAKVKQVETVPYEGDNPVAFVASANLHRRHLSVSQRAMIGAKLAKLPRGRHQIGNIADLSQPDAAALLNVSPRSVGDAAAVLANGTAAEVKAVETGKATVAETAKQVRERKQAEEIREAADSDPKKYGDLVKQLDAGGDVGKLVRELHKRQKAGTVKAEPMKDQLGTEVPSNLRDLFGDPWLLQAGEALETFARDALKSVRKRLDGKGPRFAPHLRHRDVALALTRAASELEVAHSLLTEARPYAVCPPCAGKGCGLCGKAGWLPKWKLKELKSEGKL